MKPKRTIALLLAVACAALTGLAAEPEAPKESGRDVPPPSLRKRVEPGYPEAALREGVSGIVILELIIDEGGQVASVDLVRSIPELDQAAIAAARQWRFAVTRVGGKPVRVRHTVPVTFTLRVPEVRRQRGIPELRRGLTPAVPPVVSAPPAVSAVAEVTLAPDGSLSAVELREGQKPWSDALLSAVRTWRFASGEADVTLSFRVEAVFRGSGSSARVTLNLTGLRQASTAAAETAPSAEPLVAAAAPSPTPSTSPDESGTVLQTESDVINVPAPTPTPTPRAPLPPGTSAVAGVVLEQDVPDLLSGRRPVVPPLARVRDVSGTVLVRFTVDGTGRTVVQEAEGPEALREQAYQAVRSWTFRVRLPAERLFLIATFVYAGDTASARVRSRD